MSTVTNSHIDEGAPLTAASVNTAFTGLTDGYNAVEVDDIADNAMGYETVEPCVVDVFLFDGAENSKAGGFTFTPTSAHPTFDPVVINSIDMKAYTTGGGAFEIGPAAANKVKGVLVGAAFETTGSLRCALGVKHTGDPAVQVITATDFLCEEGSYCMEWFIDGDEVPTGESVEEIWLLAANNTGSVAHGQIWAMALHG